MNLYQIMCLHFECNVLPPPFSIKCLHGISTSIQHTTDSSVEQQQIGEMAVSRQTKQLFIYWKKGKQLLFKINIL